MSTSADLYATKFGNIPRLTHGNYLALSNAIKFVLIGCKAWRIVKGEEEEPEVGNTVRSREIDEKYLTRADKALSTIYGSVSPALQGSIAGFATPRESGQPCKLAWTLFKVKLDPHT